MKRTLLKILEIKLVDINGSVLWHDFNLPNTFHKSGEEYCIRALFTGGTNNLYIPENYYLGLDSRTSISIDDTMTTIAAEGHEPTSGGYVRQAVGSLNQFTISLNGEGHTLALSPVVTFVATIGGTGWGPVSNLFLTTKTDNTGYLIASVPLSQSTSVSAGNAIHMRMSLSLAQCP